LDALSAAIILTNAYRSSVYPVSQEAEAEAEAAPVLVQNRPGKKKKE
jgi:L-rhamnose isomerase